MAQEDLDSFLAVSEELEVKGLTPGENLSNSATPTARPRGTRVANRRRAPTTLTITITLRPSTASGLNRAKNSLSLNNNTRGVPQIKKEQELFSNIQIGEAVHVEDESETNEPFYPSKASDGLLASDEGPEKVEHNKSDLRRSKRSLKLGG